MSAPLMDLHTVTTWRDATPDLLLVDDETWLAGGTWLFSEPQPDVRGLVDLTALGWAPWVEDVESSDGTAGVEIAATCTIEELVARADASAQPGWSIARECAESLVMSSKVWASATVGGNVCLALPAGGMTSLLAGLGAVATVLRPATSSSRAVPVADLVTGDGRTSLRPGELVRSFHVPATSLASSVAVRRFALTAMGRAGGVVVGRRAQSSDPGSDEVVVTVTAATPHPVVLRVALADHDTATTTVADEVARAVASVPAWFDDPHGAPDWRAAQTLRCVRDVVEELAP